MSNLKIIEKPSEIEELIHYCKQTNYASVDFETTSLEFYSPLDYPLILGVSFQPGSSWILPLGHKDSPFKKTWKKHFRVFGKEVIEDFNIVKIAWNLKFEYKWFMRYDIFMKGRLFDAQLAKYCLDEERPHDLKNFVRKFFPKYAGYENDIKVKDEDGEAVKVDWQNTPLQDLSKYCGIDTDLTFRGMVYLEKRLIKLNFYSLFRNLLMMTTRVLAEAEYQGMKVDKPYLESLLDVYKIKIEDCLNNLNTNKRVLKYEKKFKKAHIDKLIEALTDEIEELQESNKPNATRLINARHTKIKNILEGKFTNKERYDGFNFGSPKQLSEFLFESKFGLRLKPKKYTDTGKPSTDEESLLGLKNKDKSGFMDNLLEYRGLTKLNSTYIQGTYEKLDYTDRVHTSFLVHGTVTGRLSSKNPNLQNIPRGSTAADIKKMFIPPPGFLMLEVDYSQAELRVVAEIAQDKAMIDIFKRNYNIHVATACKMNGGLKLYDKVKAILKIAESLPAKDLQKPENKEYLFWVKQKKKGKSLNFSILYQQGDSKTADTLECSKEEAANFKKQWFKEFPGVAKWVNSQKKFAKKNGFVYNLFGRKRRLYNIDSDVYGLKLEAERQSINAPIQGTASDFTLFSLVVIREEWLKGNLPRDLLLAYTVHDSLGFYIRPKDIHTVVPKLISICNNPQTQDYFGFELKDVRMKVSPEVGKNWADLKDYSAEENYTKWV